MAATDSKELKVREKQELAHSAEQTPPGLVFTPNVRHGMTAEVSMAAIGLKGVNLIIDVQVR